MVNTMNPVALSHSKTAQFSACRDVPQSRCSINTNCQEAVILRKEGGESSTVCVAPADCTQADDCAFWERIPKCVDIWRLAHNCVLSREEKRPERGSSVDDDSQCMSIHCAHPDLGKEETTTRLLARWKATGLE
jgi:hypothetical protein